MARKWWWLAGLSAVAVLMVTRSAPAVAVEDAPDIDPLRREPPDFTAPASLAEQIPAILAARAVEGVLTPATSAPAPVSDDFFVSVGP